MDFKQLRYILKVAETKNVTRAAEELFITQPALSHYIAKVEKDVGMALFERSTTPISLTVAGEHYVRTARQILQMEANLKEQLADIASLKKGRIIMGLPPARAAYVLPFVLSKFRNHYPGVELRTLEKNSTVLKQAVLSGEADFAFLPWLEEEAGLEGETLFMEELFLVASKGKICQEHLKSPGIVDFERIKDMDFVLLRQNRGIRQMVEGIFLQYGTEPKAVMETSSNESAYRLAAAGLGLAIVPAMTLYTVRNEPEIEIYHLSEKGMRWPLAFVHRKGEYLNVLKLELSDLLQELFEAQPLVF